MSGALGLEQLKKLPMLIEERRKNGAYLQEVMKDHPNLMIQTEIGNSSWFGFSLVIRPESKLTRGELLSQLNSLGIESRPIVTGNFAKNKVCEYFDYSISHSLKNADYIDQNGLFIGNQHYNLNNMLGKLGDLIK
jgi:CDP-6-deoxy-D-xylo-4-hexulose-3-dehydrase